MRMKWTLVILLTCCVQFPIEALAGDAGVLPKGNFAFNIDYTHYIPWDERYDKDGNTQDAAADYNAVLDSNVFPALRMFEGYVEGMPNIGKTVTSFDYSYERIDFALAYGVTDKLSVGIKVPYIWYKNKVKANVDTKDANLGKNSLYQQGVLPPELDALPLLPLDTPGLPPGVVTPITTEDVQDILGDGLDINGVPAIPGYGYDRFETWDEDGIGDIEAGMKYQYYQSDIWRLALQGGVLFPTGKGPDPDNLQSQILGGDSYALIFRSYNDYTGFKNMTLNGSVYYSWVLPQKNAERRIVDDPHSPLTYLKDDVDIDPGDVIELETSISYQFDDESFLPGLSLGLLYNYKKIFEDKVTGPGSDSIYKGLEEETNGKEQLYIASIGYSTIPLFLKNEFPVPMDVSLAYRDKFDGNNSSFKTQYLKFSLTIYF